MILYLLGWARHQSVAAALGELDQWLRVADQLRLQFRAVPAVVRHQYSHCWSISGNLSDAYMNDKGTTYFENSRCATLAQRAYVASRTRGFIGYGTNLWGLTACDGPGSAGFFSYIARGAPPALNDDGTIAPTAAGGSMAFAPEYSLPALRYFYDQFRTNIWTGYGFRDAFNLTANWWDPDVLGIDQGPILIMLETIALRKSGNSLCRFPIQRGLQTAGFVKLPLFRSERNAVLAPGVYVSGRLGGRSYQVEYSPDLLNWFGLADRLLSWGQAREQP